MVQTEWGERNRMRLDKPRNVSCHKSAEERLHLPLISVGMNWLGNRPRLPGPWSESHFSGLTPNCQRGNVRLIEGQYPLGLSGGRFFMALFGKFYEIEIQSKSCKDARHQ